MVTRDSAYFCTSTYQLFSILSLVLDRKEAADLYIDPQFKGAEEYASRIEAKHIFEEVRIIDSKKIHDMYISCESGIKNHLQIARSYLHVNRIADMIVPGNIRYKNVFVSSRAYIPRLYIMSCYKRKYDINVFYFDDGVGSYYGNRALTPRKMDGVVRKVLFGKKALDFDHDRYLMCPDLYRKINGDTPYAVHPVRYFWSEDRQRDLLDEIFPSGEGSVLSERAVILEELADEYFDEANLQILKETYDFTRSLFGADDLLIKSHPRSKGERKQGFHYYEHFELPFEILSMKNRMADKVLISCGSTAVSTPKMITGQEPYVILLYRMIDHSDMNNETLDRFFVSLKDIYENKGKVMMPGTLEEFKTCLSRVKSEMNV